MVSKRNQTDSTPSDERAKATNMRHTPANGLGRDRASAEQQLSALARVSATASSSEAEVTILSSIAATAARILSAPMVSVFLYTEQNKLKHIAGFGLSAQAIARLEELNSAELMGSFLAGSISPLVMSNAQAAPAPGLMAYLASTLGIVSLASVPLVSGNRVLGLLSIYNDCEHSYTEGDLDALRLLANLAALTAVRTQQQGQQVGKERARDHFFSLVSHELRTPLTSIMGFTQLIRKRVSASREADPRLLQQLDVLWLQAQRLDRLIDTFVDISHIERGDFAIVSGSLNLCSVVRAVVAQSLSQLNMARDIRLDIPDDPVWVQGDRQRLEQAFTHLISNAICYSPPDKFVAIALQKQPDAKVTVTITDRGPGIPASRLRTIFEPYHRGDSLRSGGLGVGLYISKTIVEAHGGSLHAESSPRDGTTMTVILPA